MSKLFCARCSKIYQFSIINGHGAAVAELHPLLLHDGDAAVDDFLVKLKVGNAVAEQTSGSFVLFKDGDGVAHVVQGIGGCES